MKTGTLPWVPEAFRFPCLRPAADEAPRRTREKTSGTQGTGTFQLLLNEKCTGVRLFRTFTNR